MNLKSKDGSLIIIILWISAILALIGVSLGYRTALEIHSTRAANAVLQASYLARAAAAHAITVLKKDKTLNQDTLNDVWANNPGEFEKVSIGLLSFGIYHGIEKEKTFGLVDEERKISLNTAPKEVLENLFTELEIDIDLIPYLLDWIDSDDDDRNNGRGAENDHYENLNPSYKTKNDAIESFEECALIKNFTPEIIEKLKPVSTVYGSGQINLNTALSSSWKALGFSDAFIEKVERFRLGPDGERGTDDDGAAVSPQDFISKLDQFEGLQGEEKNLLNKFKNYFRVTSTAYKMKAHIKSSLHIEQVVTAMMSISKGKDVEIVYWHEN